MLINLVKSSSDWLSIVPLDVKPEDKQLEFSRRTKAMSLKRRKHTREFKLQVLREIEAGKSIAAVAREHEIHPSLISKVAKPSRQVCGF